MDLVDAVARAWAYTAEAIRRAPGFGAGHGPLDHGWPLGAGSWPVAGPAPRGGAGL
jgi:hypothetical protein